MNNLNLDAFITLFPKNPQIVFEDLTTEIFCEELNLNHGVNRRNNQKAIESDPVEIRDKKYAYQAKYYSLGTKIKDRKLDIIECIRGAACVNVTDLMIYINLNFENTNNKTGKEAAYIQEIERTALYYNIRLHWRTKSYIESTLKRPEYSRIKNDYFNTEGTEQFISSFYDKAVEIIESKPINSIYGDISLKDGYIEPHIIVDNRIQTAQKYLEDWITKNNSIAIIHGAPGHGKTSMCWKAMFDFYQNNWLIDKVANVFCFSLNPTYVNMNKGIFNPVEFLSWGNDEREQLGHHLAKSTCRRALIFFDAYDELKECVNDSRTDLFRVIQQIKRFQQDTHSHIVITSRTMAIRPFLTEDIQYGMALQPNAGLIRNFEKNVIPAFELQPVSRTAQIKWINTYRKFCYNAMVTTEWDKYITEYINSFNIEEYNKLIGIPIIFRMIVTLQYIPQKNERTVQLYDDLFDLTWNRHVRLSEIDNKALVHKSLQNHALTLFINEAEAAIPNTSERFPWLFAFYTTYYKKNCVGFLHRSFYHYFLAHKIISWYIDYSENQDMDIFQNNLSYFSYARIDSTTLDYIKQVNDDFSGMLYEAITASYKILKNTDGFVPPPWATQKQAASNEKNVIRAHSRIFMDELKVIGELERSNHIFWNVITVGCSCGHTITENDIDVSNLRKYNLSDCVLQGASLCDGDLHGADLNNAQLQRSSLINTNLRGADLSNAQLQEAFLDGADLRGANLSNAQLQSASLRNAVLRGADLCNAKLQKAVLESADFCGAELKNADLRGAILNGASLRSAELRNANLRNVSLIKASVIGANFSGADLQNADLRGASVINACLIQANLNGADLRGISLSGVSLHYASLQNAVINSSSAEYLKAHGIDISNMIIKE